MTTDIKTIMAEITIELELSYKKLKDYIRKQFIQAIHTLVDIQPNYSVHGSIRMENVCRCRLDFEEQLQYKERLTNNLTQQMRDEVIDEVMGILISKLYHHLVAEYNLKPITLKL